METHIIPELLARPEGQEAERILRNCVHCGFCTATCPTYQLLGDELDSPRGRIYLIKQMLEGHPVTDRTRIHLDRCLTCRACETTCPSGVEYGKLLDVGRNILEQQQKRPVADRLQRWLLSKIIPYSKRFGLLVRTGHLFSFLLPGKLKVKLPQIHAKPVFQAQTRTRKLLMLNGCTQNVTHAHIDILTAKILDRFDIEIMRENESGCCGALNQHLSATRQARRQMRANIDYWHKQLQDGAEVIISSASGCTAHLKEYAHLFAHEPEYADKARIVSEHVRDLSEIIRELPLERHIKKPANTEVAYHPPCTLQHGQQLPNIVEPVLEKCGYKLQPVHDSHLCCGSAGTYSILQAELSNRLLKNKLDCLMASSPECIATANIGCLMHLESTATVPVKHWIELVHDAMQA